MQCSWIWVQGKLQLTCPLALQVFIQALLSFVCMSPWVAGFVYIIIAHIMYFAFKEFSHLNFKKLSDMLTLHFLLNCWVFFFLGSGIV